MGKKVPVDKPGDLDIWKIVPPEEKLAMMARSHATGTTAVLLAAIVSGTAAVALKLPWLFWGVLLGSPFIFQFAAGRTWRNLRPRVMLEYLAARSAARRYAFATKSKDLKLELLFRGVMRKKFSSEEQLEALEAAAESNDEASVWIALFSDAVVLMSEKSGGAKLEFAHQINERLEISADAEVGRDGYQSLSKVEIKRIRATNGPPERFELTSPYPAALVVFERKLDSYAKAARAEFEERRKLLEGTAAPEGVEDYSALLE